MFESKLFSLLRFGFVTFISLIIAGCEPITVDSNLQDRAISRASGAFPPFENLNQKENVRSGEIQIRLLEPTSGPSLDTGTAITFLIPDRCLASRESCQFGTSRTNWSCKIFSYPNISGSFEHRCEFTSQQGHRRRLTFTDVGKYRDERLDTNGLPTFQDMKTGVWFQTNAQLERHGRVWRQMVEDYNDYIEEELGDRARRNNDTFDAVVVGVAAGLSGQDLDSSQVVQSSTAPSSECVLTLPPMGWSCPSIE